jgi:monovalent cation:proton antiporter-2 (CPA2) family protein
MGLLAEITLLLLAAALAAPFGKLSRIGSVLAFVGVGVLIGPSVLGLMRDTENMLHFAEIGVVFLLFIIGLELQPKRLWALRKLIFGAGIVQLAATSALLFAVLQLTSLNWQTAVIISYGLALSSTAFALRLLADNQELATAQGRLAFGILLFQDLAIIPFLALIPMLALPGAEAAVDDHGGLPGWLALILFCGFILAGHFLLLPFLRLVAWTRVQEAFTATALLLVLGSALAMEALGLSMGLGAFLAGVLVADSEYRHQLEADIEPFKALLLGLFFMAVGMSTNIGILRQSWHIILAAVVVLIVLKMVVLTLIGHLSGLDRRRSLRLAAYLCQGGEFGFVAFTVASQYQILTSDLKDQLVMVVTLSMALTPLVLKVITLLFREPGLSAQELNALSLPENAGPGGDEDNEPQIIIAGFGRFGQILGRILTAQGIPYTAIDINPEQVKLVRQFGNKVYYGDLSHQSLLESAHVGDARILALCIDDVEASIHIVEQLKRHYPDLRILVRARNRHHEIRLRNLQVDFVIRETLLSSLEFTRQVLLKLGCSAAAADNMIATFTQVDSRLIEQQTALADDQDSMRQTAQEAATEFRRLLQIEQQELPAAGTKPSGLSSTE